MFISELHVDLAPTACLSESIRNTACHAVQQRYGFRLLLRQFAGYPVQLTRQAIGVHVYNM